MEYTQILIKVAVSFVIAVALTPLIIPILRRIKAGQSIREEGPQSHMVKSGTPTMGGIIIILAVFITCLTSGTLNSDMWILLGAFLGFGIIGFIDDFVKVAMKRNLGLTAIQKLILQVAIAVGLAVYQSSVSVYGTVVYIPIIKAYWDFGLFYIPFVAFVVVAMVNAVNLTDGLDGLSSGVTAIVSFFLAMVGVNFFFFNAAAIFCAAISGACLGFLMYNKYPAKLFMGDTGSLALGGGLAAAAILMNVELILPIAGFIYVAEALSVVIQVLYFKKTGGKRFFRMAPLHHHFELGGWKETKVVVVFWGVTLLLCIASLLLL